MSDEMKKTPATKSSRNTDPSAEYRASLVDMTMQITEANASEEEKRTALTNLFAKPKADVILTARLLNGTLTIVEALK